MEIVWEALACAPDELTDPAALERATTWMPATVPSTIASVLRAAGHLDIGRDFDREDVWYRARFVLAPAAPGEEIVLVCEGLATVADVWLNGAPLFTSESMFVAHERPLDIEGDVELAIRFRALAPLLGQKRPRPRWRVPMITEQQLRWFRTTLLGRTPGWSPPVAAVGPFRPIRIERRTHGVRDITLGTRIDGDAGVVELTCRARETGLALVVEHGGTEHRAELARDGERWRARLVIPAVTRWWPHTHGAPALHRARLVGGGTTVELGALGFRTITVDRDDGDFRIVVNGVRVFCRGACWTPLDAISLGAPREATDLAIAQVRAAGMNMLRVGGTMVYEDDAFFDACDREGILVWQDFMFANVDVPEGNDDFDRLVALEARQQLRRLQARPSLALLCGNSEGEQQAAMWGTARELWAPALFHRTLPAIAAEIRPDVPYWPSSAHGGSFPHQPTDGTTSYYGVGAYLRPLDDARRSEVRFPSECLAFANVPHATSIAKMPGGASSRVHQAGWKARAPRDLGAGWDFDDVRDHYLAELFGVDPPKLRYADHDRYLALSRIVSGEVMARTFGEWRRRRSRTGGGLVWFLRDLWHGAGWGVVDAAGEPKAAYHFLRRALAPVAVSISDEGQSGLFVHVVNDRPEPLAATLDITLYRHGEVSVAHGARVVEVPAHDAIELPANDLLEAFFDTSYAYRFGPPTHDLVVVRLGDGPVAVHLPLGLARDRQSDLGLVANAAPLDDRVYELTLSTRRFAQSVAIEVDGFVASDDCFHVLPGIDHRLVLRRTTTKATPPRGTVLALNAEQPTKIQLA